MYQTLLVMNFVQESTEWEYNRRYRRWWVVIAGVVKVENFGGEKSLSLSGGLVFSMAYLDDRLCLVN